MATHRRALTRALLQPASFHTGEYHNPWYIWGCKLELYRLLLLRWNLLSDQILPQNMSKSRHHMRAANSIEYIRDSTSVPRQSNMMLYQYSGHHAKTLSTAEVWAKPPWINPLCLLRCLSRWLNIIHKETTQLYGNLKSRGTPPEPKRRDKHKVVLHTNKQCPDTFPTIPLTDLTYHTVTLVVELWH